MKRLDSFVNDLFEIIIIGGKLLISYIRDGYGWVALLWKDNDLIGMRNPNDGTMEHQVWNGGVTKLNHSGINDTEESNHLVYDEIGINGRVITYDGIMGDIEDDNNE